MTSMILKTTKIPRNQPCHKGRCRVIFKSLNPKIPQAMDPLSVLAGIYMDGRRNRAIGMTPRRGEEFFDYTSSLL